MANIAAISALWLNNNRGGGLFGGASSGEVSENRYRELKEEYSLNYGINDRSVLVDYLDGSCKLSAWGNSDKENIFGQVIQAKNLDTIPAYKEFAQQKINMITPPSFMEKMMLLRRKMSYDKTAQVLSNSTLGMTSLTMGVVSVVARSYGKAKQFTLENLPQTKDKQKQTFSERLLDLTKRVDFQDDVNKLNKLEKAHKKITAEKDLKDKTFYADDRSRKSSFASFGLLSKYLAGQISLSQINQDGVVEYEGYAGFKEKGKLDVKEVAPVLEKTTMCVNMIPPATRLEKFLMKADKKNETLQEQKSISSLTLQATCVVVNKLAQHYIAQQEKNKEGFKGKEGMYNRFSDLKLRSQHEQDLVSLRALNKKITGR